ncbi:glycosyltransferase family 4 protein [Pedobacter frigidisoli]|uniref:Glycosyltransferase family 4 protein n=1 Tax=Pedobacter frigidisoli TaxID=2530455 RepID=A0A4V2MMP8_9SPHI|nr:glycosyltransferase family 4 protein [Pedobacter frigidisoli]TCD07596.1 glycosyltransferase family 4 protein [Pedobacter frigidisoli]
MKIGVISHLKHPISAPFAGGLEVFTHQVTNALTALGHQVTLFASSSSDPTLPLEAILSDDHYDQVSRTRKGQRNLPSEYIAEHHAYFGLMCKIDALGLDVIFNNSLHYIPITMANTIRTPMVTVLHTPPFYELELAIAAERRRPVMNYVTVSYQSAFNWQKLIAECPVILNGIMLQDWDFYSSPAKEQYAIWFGRIHPDKGLHLAIKAARSAGIALHVAGAISDKRYYDREIVPILDTDITLLGLLNQKQLNQEIGEASVCLITPCWQEPFGLVVAEAMACGTPIAGFNMGALPELVTAETGVLVEFGNVPALGNAICQAMGLERKRIHLHAVNRFDFHHMIAAYEQLLEDIIEEKRNLNYAI